MTPNGRLSGFLTKKLALLGRGTAVLVFCDPRICQKCVHTHSPIPTPSAHSRSFDAQLLCPNVKSWLHPWNESVDNQNIIDFIKDAHFYHQL